MKKIHTIIYIPGLGDHKLGRQALIIKWWRAFGVQPIIFTMNWLESGTFEDRMEKLLEKIDELIKKDHAVSIIGVSAGASVALSVFSKRKDTMHKVVCLCGKIGNLDAINPRYFKRHPNFHASIKELEKSLPTLTAKDKKRVLSIYPIYDEVVPIKDAILQGSKQKALPIVGHVLGIAYGISIGSFGIVRFIKQPIKI
ncbi:hypothetical protein KC939_00470 [Candidatus Saccharibacteria bacterium]|nr:hypothetical protein [Candidatus Saccharibacteria bacterium]